MANSRNLPGGIRDGKQSGQRTGIPGIIFYNNFGDEIGGLIYPARTLESGYDGGVQLSMDQIKQTGQAVALRHWRSGDYVRSMLEITDYSTERFAGDANEDPEIGAVLKRLGEAGKRIRRGYSRRNTCLCSAIKATSRTASFWAARGPEGAGRCSS